MKRIYTLLSVSLIMLLASSANAQVKSYLGLYGGLSLPQNDFGQSNYDNNKAGFAKKGVVFGLDGAVYLYKNLGIGGTISFQDQGQLTYNDAYTLAQGYTGSFNADQSTVTAIGRYHSVNILLGPQYSFAFHKFILDLRASAGIVKVYSTPELTTEISGVPEQTSDIIQHSASTTLFGYSGTAALRWKFADNWSLVARGSYINTQGPTITTTGRTENVGRLVTRQPITVLQTTIGLAVDL